MRYFKHSNYTSFTRQLNYYNFKKVDQQSIPHHRNQNVTFSHPFFQRCHPEDMKNIMRKHQSPTSPRRMSPTTIIDLQHPRYLSLRDSIQHCECGGENNLQNNNNQNMQLQLQDQQQQNDHYQYQSQQCNTNHQNNNNCSNNNNQQQEQQQPQGPTYLRSRAHDVRFSNFIDAELYYAPLSPPPEFSFNTSPVVPPLLSLSSSPSSSSYEMSDNSDDTLFSPEDLDFLLDEDTPNSNQ